MSVLYPSSRWILTPVQDIKLCADPAAGLRSVCLQVRRRPPFCCAFLKKPRRNISDTSFSYKFSTATLLVFFKKPEQKAPLPHLVEDRGGGGVKGVQKPLKRRISTLSVFIRFRCLLKKAVVLNVVRPELRSLSSRVLLTVKINKNQTAKIKK